MKQKARDGKPEAVGSMKYKIDRGEKSMRKSDEAGKKSPKSLAQFRGSRAPNEANFSAEVIKNSRVTVKRQSVRVDLRLNHLSNMNSPTKGRRIG
jgi:hypothetical protein